MSKKNNKTVFAILSVNFFLWGMTVLVFIFVKWLSIDGFTYEELQVIKYGGWSLAVLVGLFGIYSLFWIKQRCSLSTQKLILLILLVIISAIISYKLSMQYIISQAFSLND